MALQCSDSDSEPIEFEDADNALSQALIDQIQENLAVPSLRGRSGNVLRASFTDGPKAPGTLSCVFGVALGWIQDYQSPELLLCDLLAL